MLSRCIGSRVGGGGDSRFLILPLQGILFLWGHVTQGGASMLALGFGILPLWGICVMQGIREYGVGIKS